MSHLKGSNIFSQRGLEGIDRTLIQKLYFSSNSADSFKSLQERIEATGCGEPIEKFRGYSFSSMCDPAKTMSYKPSKAGLLGRSSLTSQRDFTPKPLDGIHINNEARLLFKNKSEGGNVETDNGNFTGTTTSRAEYPDYTSQQVMAARPQNFKPIPGEAQIQTSGGENYVKTSMSNSQFTNFDPNIIRILKAESFKPKNYRRVNKHEVVAKTIYKTDFCVEDTENKMIPDVYSQHLLAKGTHLNIADPSVSMADMLDQL